MSRPRKLATAFASLAVATSLLISGCSSDPVAEDGPAPEASENVTSPTETGEPTQGTRPGADGSTLRYVFTVLGEVGAPPNPEAEGSSVPKEQVEEAAAQLKARFAALGKEDAVTVDGDKIIVEVAGLADDLLYLASLAPLNVQVRQVMAIIDGDGKFAPEPGANPVEVVETNTLTQEWIDDVADRNCLDPLKMSIAVSGAPNDSYVAYCVPAEFVRSAGTNEDPEVIREVQKIIYGPALISNSDIAGVSAEGEETAGRTIDFTVKGTAQSQLQSAVSRISNLPVCDTVKSAPTVEQVERGCGEVSVIIDGLALSLAAADKTVEGDVVRTPFVFVGWEPRLVAEAAPIFGIDPLTFSFQRVE